MAFLEAAFLRVAFFRVAFFRVAFLEAAFLRVAFLRVALLAVALRRAAVFFRVTLRRATFFLRTRVRAAVFFRVAFFRVLFAFFFMSDSAFPLEDRSKVVGAVRPQRSAGYARNPIIRIRNRSTPPAAATADPDRFLPIVPARSFPPDHRSPASVFRPTRSFPSLPIPHR